MNKNELIKVGITGSVESVDEIIASVDGDILVNSEDDIVLPKEGIVPPISFEGLPEYNIIYEYVNYIRDVSDTYPEYSLQNAFAGLSTLVQRKLSFNINGNEHYTNLILLNLGQSGYSRKTSAMSPMQKILSKSVGNVFLSPDVTPEGLIIEMADNVVIGNSEPIEPQENNEVRKALCTLWKDEAGQFYAQLNKPHMQGYKELICHFYDCPESYEKNLSSKHITINEIYFGMNLSTTPSSFYRNINNEDIGSGFLARHNIVNPSYKKERKDITQNTTKDLQKEKFITGAFKLLNSILPEKAINVHFGDKTMQLLNHWAKEREEYFSNEHDELMGSFFARFQVSVLKMAILIELGNYPYLLYREFKKHGKFDKAFTVNSEVEELSVGDESDFKKFIKDGIPNFELTFMKISSASLLYAIKLHDEIYIPYTQLICNNSGITTYNSNNVSVVIRIIKAKQKIDYSTLLRNSNIKSSELREILFSLKEGEIIEEYLIKTKGKPKKVLVFIPPKIKKLEFSSLNESRYSEEGVFSLKKIEKVNDLKINLP